MVPSSRWFPTNWADRVVWFQNFATQFASVAASLGLSAKVAQVNDDNTVMQFMGGGIINAEAFVDAIRQYRKIITEDAIGTPTPEFPANPTLELPKIVTTGIFTRLDKLVDQIRNADNYTDEIGALLGILPKGSDSITPELLKPTLKGQAMPAQKISVEFVRGKTDGINLQMQVDGGDWTNEGNFYKSPADLTAPGDASKPHQVNLRARFLDGNTPVGQYSDIITIVTQP